LQALAIVENPTLSSTAIHYNNDGTRDLGLMQLNDSWYKGDWQNPITNITAACKLIRELLDYDLNYYQVAIAYNCGYTRFLQGPPNESINHAVKVFEVWGKLERYKILGNRK
jgi:soluble lytic murein transglycosylase-like protein